MFQRFGDEDRRDHSLSPGGGDSDDEVLGRDDHTFRRIARDKPGFTFAHLVADTRTNLGQELLDGETALNSQVFRKWYEHHFKRKFGGKLSDRNAEEMDLLVLVLDEVLQGRVLEAADMLSSRLKCLTFGIDSTDWEAARQFLGYRPRANSIVSLESQDIAVQLAKRQRQRAADLQTSKKQR